MEDLKLSFDWLAHISPLSLSLSFLTKWLPILTRASVRGSIFAVFTKIIEAEGEDRILDIHAQIEATRHTSTTSTSINCGFGHWICKRTAED